MQGLHNSFFQSNYPIFYFTKGMCRIVLNVAFCVRRVFSSNLTLLLIPKALVPFPLCERAVFPPQRAEFQVVGKQKLAIEPFLWVTYRPVAFLLCWL